jgi:competence protein ComEA
MFLTYQFIRFSRHVIVSLLLSTFVAGFSAATIAASENPAKPVAVKMANAGQVVEQSVNINTDSAEVISASLKGIGLKKAQAIIDWRTANGAFVSVEQLIEVKGIGEKTLMANKDKIKL